MVNLVEHGRISTTVAKAKELRRHIEKAITLGKTNDLATRRLLLSRIPNQATVEAILGDISPRFNTRPGGYTRIIKIGRRPGDTAEMAFIEFVDYDYTKDPKAKLAEKQPKAKKASAKGEGKTAKAVKVKTPAQKSAKLAAAKRKSVRKMQNKSRQEARA
jgi:large subunit ribosomal protein L17